MISGRFDTNEAAKRLRGARVAGVAEDDDGKLLANETQFDILEVAHILPHALTETGQDSEMVIMILVP